VEIPKKNEMVNWFNLFVLVGLGRKNGHPEEVLVFLVFLDCFVKKSVMYC
jgi:hypothetical protein